MARVNIKKGLDIPITGLPRQEITEGRATSKVALVGPDYVGMKPTMEVQVGDQVAEGQLLFTDKKTKGVRYTSPGCGKVIEINRGAKRVFESIVIELDGNEAVEFESYADSQLDGLSVKQVKDNLISSGLWTALRTRPMSKVPMPDSLPHSIFVTAIDTNPLAADPETIIQERQEDFVRGLRVLLRLSPEQLFLCTAPNTNIPGDDLPGVVTTEFAGPHPAGLPGTHIHFLDPVDRHKTVWYIGYQDVMAIGSLFLTGRLDQRRVVSLAGPSVEDPRLIRTRIGADIDQLLEGEIKDGTKVAKRPISGSVLAGHTAVDNLAYLGRYHTQISVLGEGDHRELFGWAMPGFGKFSITGLVASKLLPWKKFSMTTTSNGSHRAIYPVGTYERVMPLDILPTFLLRALATDDVEQAEALGCLELDEEDLALCTFVCPGKNQYGQMLRHNLTIIEKEG